MEAGATISGALIRGRSALARPALHAPPDQESKGVKEIFGQVGAVGFFNQLEVVFVDVIDHTPGPAFFPGNIRLLQVPDSLQNLRFPFAFYRNLKHTPFV